MKDELDKWFTAGLFMCLIVVCVFFGVAMESYKGLKNQVLESEPIKLEKNVYMCSQVAL